MLMAAHSHHPTISILRAAAGSSTITATSGGAAAGSASTAARAAMERSGPLRCPRCDSSNTKFCYYNNYSLSQPRHFCKACKRYWTRGGTLRNVPVGGRCRKNKRPKRRHVIGSSSTATISSSADAAPITSLSSDPYKPTPFATAAATVASSVFYGHPSDASQLTFSKPSVPYDLQSLGLLPSNADEDCLPVLKKRLTDHRILQQTAPAASPTPSLASLDLQDSSVFGSNPLASLHASGLNQRQQQQKQRMTDQNPHLPQYTTLLSHATSGTSALPSDVKVEDNGEGIMTRGNSTRQSRLISWQMPSCDSALLETIAAESLNYWNAAAASAFGGGSLQ